MDIVKVGKPYIAGVQQWPEGVQYVYAQRGHELTVFLNRPGKAEIQAFKKGKVDLGVFVQDELVVLLYRIEGACEWSNAPFDWFSIPENNRRFPEPGKEPLQMLLTLVDSGNGVIRAVRILELSDTFSEAIGQALQQQIDKGTTWLKSTLATVAGRYEQPADMVSDALAVQLADKE